SSTSSTSSSYSLSFFFSRYGDPRHLHSFPTRRSSDLKNLAQVRFLSRAFFPICDEHGGISHLHSNGKNRCRMPFRRMADGRGMDEHRFVRALLYWDGNRPRVRKAPGGGFPDEECVCLSDVPFVLRRRRPFH